MIETRRIVALLGLVMAALLVLSALGASDAQAKKRQHQINTVQCGGSNCDGTDSRDRLVGSDEFDDIRGGEGDDIYDGKGGSDRWEDSSAMSNDRYLVPSTEFSQLSDGLLDIGDLGGSFDVLDLSAYKSTDFALSRDTTGGLFMDGPGKRDIFIEAFFTTDSIDTFKFKNHTLTADQIKQKA